MTVRELIIKLLSQDMDKEVILSCPDDALDSKNAGFYIKDVVNNRIVFNDWRLNNLKYKRK